MNKSHPRTVSQAGLRSLVLSVLLSGLVACSPGRNLPELPGQQSSTAGAYQIGGGDQIRLITFGEDQLTGEFRVNDDGTVALPLLGFVQVRGLTVQQVSKKIEDELTRRKLFRSPSVSTEVSTYRPIFILGEVNKPGEYPFQPGMTVLSTVSVAGGFTYRAVDDYASVIRLIDHKEVEGKVGRQTPIQPGDVITIFERRF